MKQGVFWMATLPLGAAALLAGCAEIIGLEPPGGSGGNGTTTATGGAGGSGGCDVDTECPAQGIPECTKPVCTGGKCGFAPADPGESVPCYGGPAGTENVGLCKRGLQACSNGQPVGMCVGEVTPQQEDCGTVADENCNGMDDSCAGSLLEVVTFPGDGLNSVVGVAADGDGNLYIAGTFHGTTQVAGCTLELPTGSNAASYVAKLTPTLACAWSAVVADAPSTAYLSRLTLAAGRVWAIGGVSNDATLLDGQGVTESISAPSTDADAFVFALEQTNGALVDWYVASGAGEDRGVAIASSANVVYALSQGGSGDLHSNKHPSKAYTQLAQDGQDMIVTAINATTNEPLWVRVYGSPSADVAGAITVLDKRIVIGGALGSTAAGGANPDCVTNPGTDPRAFVFDADADSGDPGLSFCGAWQSSGPGVVAGLWASSTRVVASGYSVGVTSLGCGSSNGGNSSSTSGWFRATETMKIECTVSAFLTGNPYTTGLHAEGINDDVVLGGVFQGTLFDAQAQGMDVYLARFSPNSLVPVWTVVLGGNGADTFGDFTVRQKQGDIVVVGTCAGSAFTGKAACDGLGDGFLVRIAP